jgi:hypothetical protein
MHTIDTHLGKNFYHNVMSRIESPTMAWHRGEHTATPNDETSAYYGSFSSLVFKKDVGPLNDLFDVTLSILLMAVDQQNKLLKDLHRIRIGLITRTPEPIVHSAHRDMEQAHTTGLYYLNQSDGDTIIYNEQQFSEQYSIMNRVSPNANKWINFDGTHFHSSTTPVNHEKRMVITYNYETN